MPGVDGLLQETSILSTDSTFNHGMGEKSIKQSDKWSTDIESCGVVYQVSSREAISLSTFYFFIYLFFVGHLVTREDHSTHKSDPHHIVY